MCCIKVLHDKKISQDGISTALLLAASGSFRKKAMSPEMSAECARLLLKGGHGITASPVDAKDQLALRLLSVVAGTHSARYIDSESAMQGTHSADNNFRLLHGSPLALLMSPMSKRVQVISSLDKSTRDLLSYLPDPKAAGLLAEKTRETWEGVFADAWEGCVTALAMPVVVEEKISPQASVLVEGISTKRSFYNTIGGLSIQDALIRDHSERENALLCMVQILSQHRVASWRDHNIERRSLSSLIRAAKDCVALKDNSVSCVRLLLCFKTDMKVHNLRKHGPLHMVAVQDMRFILYSASMVPWDISSLQVNQVINNKSGDRLSNDEFDYFNKSYTAAKTSACQWQFVARKCSSEMAKCALKQDSKFIMTQRHNYYMSNIFVECLTRTLESVEINAKDHKLGKTVDVTNDVLPFSCHLIELPESASDHEYPIDPPTASITEGSPHHMGSQQVDACSKRNVQSQQGNNCSRSHTERVPIFIRQISGKVVVLTVNLDGPSEHMMCLYEEKTKMKLLYQYFIYEGQTIDPEHTLLFYGVGRNSTIHACGRLLGGMHTTLASYVHDNRNKFLKEVTLPNGKISLKMTRKGCRFLSTWLNCFTIAFSMGKSWNGEFTLDDFRHVDGHILIIKKPRVYPAGSMEKDLNEFIIHVEQILHSDKEYLISKYPPYLKNFTRLLSHMNIYGVLSAQDKLLIETHVCFMASCDRETLIISLYRRYEGLDKDEMLVWDDAIKRASCPVPWSMTLSELEVVGDGRGYPESRFGAFTFIKDIAMHATDNRNDEEEVEEEEEEVQNVDDGIELMIPACIEDFLPSIIRNLVEKQVDISSELLAAKIKCFCKKCESADSSDSSDS